MSGARARARARRVHTLPINISGIIPLHARAEYIRFMYVRLRLQTSYKPNIMSARVLAQLMSVKRKQFSTINTHAI